MNKKILLTLLSKKEILDFNDGRQLEVLKRYGPESAITDLAILTGGFCNYNRIGITVPDDHSLKGRHCNYYTRSSDDDGGVCIYSYASFGFACEDRYSRECVVRPVLKSSTIFRQISPNRVKGCYGTEEVEYGEYPQYAPDRYIQNELEREYERGLLRTTGRNYTFDKTNVHNYDQVFQPITYEEYEYKGKRYIRVKANSYKGSDLLELSNLGKYRNNDKVWVEVSPVVWLIDDKTETLISKRGLLSGIRFHTRDRYYNGDFSTTDMKEYLDKYMLRDLTQGITFTNMEDITLEEEKEYEEEHIDKFYQNAYDELTKIEEDNNVKIEDLKTRYSTKNDYKEDANAFKKMLLKMKKDKSKENVDSSYEEGKKYLEEIRKQEKENLKDLMTKYDLDNSISTIKESSKKNLSEEIIEFNNIDEEPYNIESEISKDDIKKLFKKIEDILGLEKENVYDLGENVIKSDKKYNKKIIEKFDKIQEKVYEIQQNTVNTSDNINSSEKYSKEDIKELLKYIKKLNEKIDELQSDDVAKKM